MRLIDADVLLDSLKKSYSILSEIYKTESDVDEEITEAQLIVFCEVILRTKNSPTIEAVPVVHGEWIEKNYTWYCSNCDGHPYKGYTPAIPDYNICPYCGADMRKKG